MVSSLISKYAQVVLWFCRTGLLPEGSGKLIVAQRPQLLSKLIRTNPDVKNQGKLENLHFLRKCRCECI